MAKKKNKNNNYVTEKTTQAKLEKEQAKKAKRTKKIVKQIVTAVLVVVICAGCFTGLGFAFGWFDYAPTPTYDAVIEVEGYGSLHVHLYGNDNPEAVSKFKELAEKKAYDGKSFDSLFGECGIQCSSGGSVKVVQENTNPGNKIAFTKGTLAMIPPTSADTAIADGAFFILGENERSLKDGYAAFGRVTYDSLEMLEKIYDDMEKSGVRPTIKSISVHATH